MKTLAVIFLASTALGVISMIMARKNNDRKMDESHEKTLSNYYLMLSGHLS